MQPNELTREQSLARRTVSLTYGELAMKNPSLAEKIVNYEWDNMVPSEQRDWVLDRISELEAQLAEAQRDGDQAARMYQSIGEQMDKVCTERDSALALAVMRGEALEHWCKAINDGINTNHPIPGGWSLVDALHHTRKAFLTNDDPEEWLAERDKRMRAEVDWRPIESAPRDGTTIFAWIGGEARKVAYLGSNHGRREGWHMLSYNDWEFLSYVPEYWMSLPMPPSQISKEAGLL